MDPRLIFVPCSIVVIMTMVAWIRMFVLRFSYIRNNRVHWQKLKAQKAVDRFPINVKVAGEHFSNLFEVPVLFYVLCGFLYITDLVTLSMVVLAFAYAVLRAAHTYIHLTYNRVSHRFIVYAASCFVLGLMWLSFTVSILTTAARL